MRQSCYELWLAALMVLTSCCLAFDGHLIKSINDMVGAENFTYYSWEDKGPAVVVLHSLTGDADLYVSDRTRSPTYLYDHYEIKSTTCGEDVVDLSLLKRPVYIGVYGSHAYEKNEFSLSVYRPYKGSTIASSSYTYEEGVEYSSTKDSTYSSPRSKASYQDDEPSHGPLWTILDFIFKLLLEILL